MRRVPFVCLTLAVSLLVGCSSGSSSDAPVMPDVLNKALDVAKSDINRAGFDDEVEIVGGGTFGIVVESNWVVCEQLPEPGEALIMQPRLVVKRSCGNSEEEEDSDPADSIPPTTAPPTTAPPTTLELSSPPATEEKVQEATPPPPPKLVDAEAIEAKYLEHLGYPFKNMCAMEAGHWTCYYKGVHGDSSTLWVNLITDGGWSESEVAYIVGQVQFAWFNFIGCDFPELAPSSSM